MLLRLLRAHRADTVSCTKSLFVEALFKMPPNIRKCNVKQSTDKLTIMFTVLKRYY